MPRMTDDANPWDGFTDDELIENAAKMLRTAAEKAERRLPGSTSLACDAVDMIREANVRQMRRWKSTSIDRVPPAPMVPSVRPVAFRQLRHHR